MQSKQWAREEFDIAERIKTLVHRNQLECDLEKTVSQLIGKRNFARFTVFTQNVLSYDLYLLNIVLLFLFFFNCCSILFYSFNICHNKSHLIESTQTTIECCVKLS